MNALTRWDPFKEMEETQNRLARFLGLSPTRTGNGGQEAMTVTEWAPSVDITEDDKEWLVEADLPEVKKDDVKVTVENGVLTITGARAWDETVDRNSYHRIERSYGRFTRSFTLPRTVRPDDVVARFENGVLYLTLPKAEEARPRKIEIH